MTMVEVLKLRRENESIADDLFDASERAGQAKSTEEKFYNKADNRVLRLGDTNMQRLERH